MYVYEYICKNIIHLFYPDKVPVSDQNLQKNPCRGPFIKHIKLIHDFRPSDMLEHPQKSS